MAEDTTMKSVSETVPDSQTDEKSFKLNQELDDRRDAGMQRTREFVDMWRQNMNYVFSGQLEGQKKHKNWDWVIVNYIWPSIMQEMAKLSKHNPKIESQPRSEDDIEFAEAWRDIAQWMWEEGLTPNGMRIEQLMAIFDAKMFGYCVSKVQWDDRCYWDEDSQEWVGDVKHLLLHPACFWVSPEAERVEDAEACGTTRMVRLDWAQKRWPEFAEELKLQAEMESEDGQYGYGGLGIEGAHSVLGSADAISNGRFGGGSDNRKVAVGITKLLGLILREEKMTKDIPKTRTKMVRITEQYFKDETETDEKVIEDVPVEELMASGTVQMNPADNIHYFADGSPLGPENQPTRLIRKYKKPKYPYLRYVLRAGKIILNPETKTEPDAQRYPYKRGAPYVVKPHYLIPHMWQGTDAVQLYKGVQDWINVSASYLGNNLKMFGAPQWIVENDVLAKNPKTKAQYRIPNAAGAIIRVLKGAIGRLQRVDPAPIPPTAPLFYDMMSQEFKNLTGLQDSGRGIKEKNMTATEFQGLMISSNDRIQLQSVHEEWWIRRVMLLATEIAQVNYSPERMVRIIGQENTQGIISIQQEHKSAKFDLKVVAGSTLPFDEEKKIAKYERAYALFSEPLANVFLPEMLRALEIPNWKQLLQEYEVWMQWMEFKQMYEAVQAGQLDPTMAIQAFGDRMMQAGQQAMAQQAEGQPQQGGPPNESR